MIKIGIYANISILPETITLLKDFFTYDDIVVFSSAPYHIDDPMIPVLPVYYMTFYDGILVFTSENDMKKYVNDVKTSNIFLLTSNTIINIDKKEIQKNELQ